MSRNWNSGTTAYIDCAAGTLGPAGTGAYTIAALYKPSGPNGAIISLRTGATIVRQIINDAFDYYGAQDFILSTVSAPVGAWQYVAQTKQSGSALYRWHTLTYGSDPNTTAHADHDGTHNDPSVIDNVRIGDGDHPGAGDIALVAVWNRALSDVEIQAVFSPNSLDWTAKSPDAMWILPLSEAGNSVLDITGHGASQVGVVGAITGSEDPPGFQFLRLLNTPRVREGMHVRTGLWRYYSLDEGVTLLVSGTTVTQTRFPWQGDFGNYDAVYLGGHIYAITPAQATILTNAGYGAFIT